MAILMEKTVGRLDMFSRCSYLVAIFVLTLKMGAPLNAEPYLAVKTGFTCSVCHTDPSGGGARNSYGAFYGANVLPREVFNSAIKDGGQLGDKIRLGADLRYNFDQRKEERSPDSRSFNTQSAQLYLVLKSATDKYTLILDQQVAPGAAVSRQAAILMKLAGSNYVKVGRLFLPFGIRFEDDDTLVRKITQANFDSSDGGVEVGLNHSKFHLTTALTNGTSSQSNDDEALAYLLKAEMVDTRWRVGVGYQRNEAEIGVREMANLFTGAYWSGFVLLAEWGRVEDKSVLNLNGNSKIQTASIIELNRELVKGLNLKVSSEYSEIEEVDSSDVTRQSVVFEFTPSSNLQIRSGVRIGDELISSEKSDFTRWFAQAHFYF